MEINDPEINELSSLNNLDFAPVGFEDFLDELDAQFDEIPA